MKAAVPQSFFLCMLGAFSVIEARKVEGHWKTVFWGCALVFMAAWIWILWDGIGSDSDDENEQ